MKRKKLAKPPRSRNPFYRELRQLGAKVLKNKKKYDRKKGLKFEKYVEVAYTYVYPPYWPPTRDYCKSLFLLVLPIFHNIYYNIPYFSQFSGVFGGVWA